MNKCSYVLLEGDNFGSRACHSCLEEEEIALSSTLFIENVLSATPESIISNYPPLSSKQTIQTLIGLKGSISATPSLSPKKSKIKNILSSEAALIKLDEYFETLTQSI